MVADKQSSVRGEIFRLITPALITILGTISIMYLKSISLKFDQVDTKFDNFLEKYSQIDKRVDRLEYKVFNQGDISR